MLPCMRNAGAVDENVEATEGGDHRIDDLAPARLVGDVLRQDEIGIRSQLGEARLVTVGRGHPGALGVKQAPPSRGRSRRRRP